MSLVHAFDAFITKTRKPNAFSPNLTQLYCSPNGSIHTRSQVLTRSSIDSCDHHHLHGQRIRDIFKVFSAEFHFRHSPKMNLCKSTNTPETMYGRQANYRFSDISIDPSNFHLHQFHMQLTHPITWSYFTSSTSHKLCPILLLQWEACHRQWTKNIHQWKQGEESINFQSKKKNKNTKSHLTKNKNIKEKEILHAHVHISYSPNKHAFALLFHHMRSVNTNAFLTWTRGRGEHKMLPKAPPGTPSSYHAQYGRQRTYATRPVKRQSKASIPTGTGYALSHAPVEYLTRH